MKVQIFMQYNLYKSTEKCKRAAEETFFQYRWEDKSNNYGICGEGRKRKLGFLTALGSERYATRDL